MKRIAALYKMKATNKNNQDNLSINNLDFNHYVK